MKRAIDCKIERIHAPAEDAWIISIPAEQVSHGVILLTALIQGKLPQVKFADQAKTCLIRAIPKGYDLTFADAHIAVTESWLEAVLGMFLDVCLNGWTDTAHIDQDFGNISITVAILPPKL